MIIYEGEKYSCVSCIRGHRSSSCNHKDRLLVQVRKRGRPQDGDSRIAIVPDSDGEYHLTEEIGAVDSENGGYMGTPSSRHSSSTNVSSPTTHDMNSQPESLNATQGSCCSSRRGDVITIDNGKQRKTTVNTPEGIVKKVAIDSSMIDKRRGRLKMRMSKRNEALSRLSLKSEDENCGGAGREGGRVRGEKEEAAAEEEKGEINDNRIIKVESEGCAFVPVGDGLYRKESLSVDQKKGILDRAPPVMIAPMNFNGAILESLLSEMSENDGQRESQYGNFESTFGYDQIDDGPVKDSGGNNTTSTTIPVIEDILGPRQYLDTTTNGSDILDIYYAASCVLPGECECGDTCTCYGCAVHDAEHTARNNERKSLSLL